jgi:hypothetical protein
VFAFTTAKYCFTTHWNPIAKVSWVQWPKMDWIKLLGFIVGNRVAPEYSVSELLSDWKAVVGFGFRSMMPSGVVRFDFVV